MKVSVEVDIGANAGTVYELGTRSYRAIGRSGGKDVTVQLSPEGDRVLDPEGLQKVEEHIARRGDGDDQDMGSERLRVGTFFRGRDILLDDDKISRTHAMIFVDEEGPSIVDLLSRNGTHVNGGRVGDADLNDGDAITIGETRFIVRVL